MTRGDFILGVISSLIATILFELARKFYLRLQISSVIKLGKELIRIFAVPNLSARILSSSIVLLLTISVALNTSVRTVIAPTEDLKTLQLKQKSLEEERKALKLEHKKLKTALDYYEEATRLFDEGERLYQLHTDPDTTKKALDLIKKRY